MKKILGLDLGSASIGWAVVRENSEELLTEDASGSTAPNDAIVALGSRIIPLTTDESTGFSKGSTLTKNADRTQKRTQRKGYDRYQLRRGLLLQELSRLGMYSGQTLRLSTLGLWELRAKAVTEQVSLPELGRVLCHINQKRGYRTVKSDFEDKKQGKYVEAVVGRYRELHAQGLTVGQYLYKELSSDPAFRCKDRVYPRAAYVEEYDAIMDCQKRFYPEVLTGEVIAHLRDYIIFHQRPLKSCKHLVARCELERREALIGGRIRNCGPRVAPRSSPLFQVCKLWEMINNLRIENKEGDPLVLTLEQKQALFAFMNTHAKFTAAKLTSVLGLKSREWKIANAIGTGLQGNTTYCALSAALEKCPDRGKLLAFELHAVDGDKVHADTGEIVQVIDTSFEKQPLYRLWHALYSISDIDTLREVLGQNFGIADPETLDRLCRIDFVKSGYGNKSSRALRKILPYLQQGMQYYQAKCMAGYDDAPWNKEQNQVRELAERLLPVPKGELRQPVVEKVLNQLVNLVNALMAEYGPFDEIRVELARELQQSREERESASRSMAENNKRNEQVAQKIQQEYGLTPTRSRIQKYRLWTESDHQCMYCGQLVNVAEFLRGVDVEVEHIIPRSMLFDDSYSNKVCACRKCNKDKDNRTAFDFMKTKPEGEFAAYLERVNSLAEAYKPNRGLDVGISETKKRKLLMRKQDIPTDFIARQMRETQYISKKAKGMLQTVCRNVYSTSGSITDYIRHVWGWDDVLHEINFEGYRAAGLVQTCEREVDGRKLQVERIVNWSKRLDHRHHALDALVIACTKQGYIQRINNLASLGEITFRSDAGKAPSGASRERHTRLERYIRMQPHFSRAEVIRAVKGIAVSFKADKRTVTPGKRYVYRKGKRICVQRGILVPRGPLSEESVYGRIHDEGKEKYVLRYGVDTIDLKKLGSVVDQGIREILRQRLEQFGGNPKKAYATPVYDHQGRAIRSVRCFTNLKVAVPLRYDEQGQPIAFVKTGNNHHVAIYEDEKGRWHEHMVTFWHAVDRKRYGLPILITDPGDVWDRVTDRMPEDFQRQLPPSATWRFVFSVQRNEMFVLGMEEEAYRKALSERDTATLCQYLYRVQNITAGAYVFRKHTETQSDDRYPDEHGKKIFSLLKSNARGAVHWIKSFGALQALNPHKVHVSITGKISEV